MDPLEVTLLDLLHALQEADVPLILGGGYGLFLRQRRLQASSEPLLLKVAPPLRSTNDLDIFLRTELLADSTRLTPLRNALDALGFTVIPSAQNYQFARKFSMEGRQWDIKIDLLAREPDPTEHPQLRFDVRRVKPQPSAGIHAHTTPEAVAIEEELGIYTVTGKRSDGRASSGAIYLPSAYAFLMMKLFALRDQCQSPDKDFGRKHALDLYGLVALLTEPEYDQTLRLRNRYRRQPQGREAGRIVAELFADRNGIGAIRLREHPDFPGVAELPEFLATLHEVFPVLEGEGDG